MGANLSTSTSRRLTLAPQFCCVGPIVGEHRWPYRGRASLAPRESIAGPITGEYAPESSREFAALGTLCFHRAHVTCVIFFSLTRGRSKKLVRRTCLCPAVWCLGNSQNLRCNYVHISESQERSYKFYCINSFHGRALGFELGSPIFFQPQQSAHGQLDCFNIYIKYIYFMYLDHVVEAFLPDILSFKCQVHCNNCKKSIC